jgi:hypothetical protein
MLEHWVRSLGLIWKFPFQKIQENVLIPLCTTLFALFSGFVPHSQRGAVAGHCNFVPRDTGFIANRVMVNIKIACKKTHSYRKSFVHKEANGSIADCIIMRGNKRPKAGYKR